MMSDPTPIATICHTHTWLKREAFSPALKCCHTWPTTPCTISTTPRCMTKMYDMWCVYRLMAPCTRSILPRWSRPTPRAATPAPCDVEATPKKKRQLLQPRRHQWNGLRFHLMHLMQLRLRSTASTSTNNIPSPNQALTPEGKSCAKEGCSPSCEPCQACSQPCKGWWRWRWEET